MDFTKVFSTKLKGQLGSVKSVVSNSASGVLNEQLMKFKSYLLEATEKQSGILEVIASDADAISDEFIEHRASWSREELGHTMSVVGKEWASNIVDAVQAYGVDTEVGKTFLLTDSTGNSYSLATPSNQADVAILSAARTWTNENVSKVLLVARSMSVPYPVLYVVNGKVKLNNLIPTSASQFLNTDYVLPETIIEKLRWVCDDAHVAYVSEDTIEDLIDQLLMHYEIDAELLVTIDDKLSALISELGLSAGSAVTDKVNAIFEYTEGLDIKPVNHFSTFWDIIKDGLDSLGINRALLMLIESARSAKKDISAFLAAIDAKTEAMKTVVLGAIQAWNNGGYSGLSDYILSFWHTASSIFNDDGTLKFTDNNAFVPSQYIAGIIVTGVQIVSTIASVIVTAMGYVIGPVIAIAGQGIAGIIKSVSYDSTKTRCGVQTSEDAIGSVCPWALTQGSGAYYNGWSKEPMQNRLVYDMLEEGSAGAYMIDVPGGYLLIGRGPQTEGEKINDIRKYRFEFHPSCVDKYEVIYNNIVKKYVTQSWTTHAGYACSCSTVVNCGPLMLNDIEKVWADGDPGKPFANDSQDRLSAKEDIRLKNAVCANIALFYMWLQNQYYSKPVEMITDSDTYAYNNSADVYKRITTGSDFTDTLGIAEWYSLCMPRKGRWAVPGVLSINTNNCMLAYLNSWKPLADAAVHWTRKDYFISPSTAVLKRGFYGDAIPIDGSVDWGIVPAEYDGATFWAWVVATALVTVAIAVTTIVSSIKIKQWRRKQANLNRVKVEHAYDTLKGNPTPENLKAYNRAVTKNNLMSGITGGSKINKLDYWGSTETPAEESNSEGEQTSIVSRICGSPENESFRDGASVTSIDSTRMVLNAITGSSGDPLD